MINTKQEQAIKNYVKQKNILFILLQIQIVQPMLMLFFVECLASQFLTKMEKLHMIQQGKQMKESLKEGRKTVHLVILRNKIDKLIAETPWNEIEKQLPEVYKGIEIKAQLIMAKKRCDECLNTTKEPEIFFNEEDC